MKRILSLCLFLIVQFALYGQAGYGTGDNFNPENPGNPEFSELMHKLTVTVEPEGAGETNFAFKWIKEGDSIDVYAYSKHSDFKLKCWQIAGKTVSTENCYWFTMGREDAKLTAVFEFNPTSPDNPNKNFWDANTGHLILDDFEPGEIYSAAQDIVGGNSSAVTMITVSGKINSSDFSVGRDYENCTVVDFSRAYGFQDVPSYAYANWESNSKLQKVIIPSCVQRIGYDAFYNCTNLSEIVCYSMVPPVVESGAFSGLSDATVVRVPQAAKPLYMAAEGWKNFQILDLEEDIRALAVTLPEDAADGRYKNQILELVNAETGQKLQYIITDRIEYKFGNVLKDCVYDIYVRTNSNEILGEIKGVTVGDENVEVAFETLLQLQSVKLVVQTPEGEDVTSKVQITWLNAEKAYLKSGAQVTGLLPETVLYYNITLGEELGVKYLLPSESNYVVTSEANEITYTLVPLQEMRVEGKVINVQSSAPLKNAVVSVTQKLNAQYSKSFITRTDDEGNFSINVIREKATLMVTALDFSSVTQTIEELEEIVALDDIALKPLVGKLVNISFTYTNSVKESETPVPTAGYDDYANVMYSIYNVTQNREITEFAVQYPKITLTDESVKENDRIRITASSKTNAFVPVAAEGIIDASTLSMSVTLPIVALGGIHASYAQVERAAVVGILYDANGYFIGKYSYNNGAFSINNLADGEYILVSMISSNLFNSVYNLSQFAEFGLVAGSDYALDRVTVQSGVVASIENDAIPVLNESKLYYTGENTSFTVNKSSTSVGKYLTMKAVIDFKDVYEGSVSDVKLVVDLPESADFVDNSVMIGTKIVSYTMDGSRLIIPVEDFNKQIRFCIVPEESGEFSPSASVSFTVGDNNILQPIGSAPYKAKDLSIVVPSKTGRKNIPVSGTANGKSEVYIYDNGILIAQTTSLANGAWRTKCELIEDAEEQRHSIHAVCVDAEGRELQTEAKECLYDENAIEPLTVTMINVAHPATSLNTCEYVTKFDFIDPPASFAPYWYWPDYPNFTFLVELSTDNVDLIAEVYINVYDITGAIQRVKATYNSTQKIWVAKKNFYSHNLPKNVTVSIGLKDGSMDIDYIPEPNNPDVAAVMDPSGFVYEGVSSNRIEGVTATAYYKETLQDQYGDPYENIVLWNAEEYAQQNPLFTDENGMYAWDVPQGLWQVRFEKDGYQPTQSEWLPVPPPQLEVNIPMVQITPPEVKTVKAYEGDEESEGGVDIEFSKYMQIETLTTGNIYVIRNGSSLVYGTVTLLNKEANEDESAYYASKLRFVPQEELLTTDDLRLFVSRKVRSYAGVQMAEDHTQDFDIEKAVKKLEVSEKLAIEENGAPRTITVSAQPYDAAIGKTLTVQSSSDRVLSLSATELTFDANGQASVEVTGNMLGFGVLTFSMPDADVKATTNISVDDVVLPIPEKPLASLASGSAVYRNTDIVLSSDTENATIYYTADGSNPAFSSTRVEYDEPIQITADGVTTIKAYAVGTQGYESDQAEYNYKLKSTVTVLNAAEGWNWISHNVETSVPSTLVQERVAKIVGQKSEIIKDPVYGFVGGLSSLAPSEMYKVKQEVSAVHEIKGYAYNPATPITLQRGWNWLGYPVDQVMSLDEAFANLTPDEGDYIIGQDGFAEYADGAWSGTLATLVPGKGYMYQSMSQKNFSYNTAVVSKAKALSYRARAMKSPWTVDVHKYPSIMPVVANLYRNDAVVDINDYYVGAFCGTECRGIGKCVDGTLMISIYGEIGDDITFVAVDKDTETIYTIKETEAFTETKRGSVRAPYKLTIGEVATHIGNVDTGCKVWPVLAETSVYVAGKNSILDKVMLTDMNGCVVFSQRNVPSGAAVNVSALSQGMYIVTVVCGEHTFYQKIIKK